MALLRRSRSKAKRDDTWCEIHLDWETDLKFLQTSFVKLWSSHFLGSKAGKSFPTKVVPCPLREGKRVESHGSRPENLLVFGKWGDFVVTQSLVLRYAMLGMPCHAMPCLRQGKARHGKAWRSEAISFDLKSYIKERWQGVIFSSPSRKDGGMRNILLERFFY
jgi:hypothetical protein